jgi:hypothetical protein
MVVIVMEEHVEQTSVHALLSVSGPLNKEGDAMLERNDGRQGAACVDGGLALGVDAFKDR